VNGLEVSTSPVSNTRDEQFRSMSTCARDHYKGFHFLTYLLVLKQISELLIHYLALFGLLLMLQCNSSASKKEHGWSNPK